MDDDVATDAKSVIARERGRLNPLIEEYATARSLREAASDEESRLRKIEIAAEGRLFDALERENLRSARHETLGLFTLDDKANAVITDEPALREWAQEAMPELMLPNRQRLGKVVRDALKEGDELPPGVEASFYRKISWRRGGAGAS